MEKKSPTITVQEASEHQVDANVESLTTTQMEAGQPMNKETDLRRSGQITGTSNNDSSEHRSAGDGATGAITCEEKTVDQARQPGAKKIDDSKSGSSSRSPSEDNGLAAISFPSGMVGKG